jgi:segregation and condensation protein B
MTADESHSLADQAASWVPPWARRPAPGENPAADDVPATASDAVAAADSPEAESVPEPSPPTTVAACAPGADSPEAESASAPAFDPEPGTSPSPEPEPEAEPEPELLTEQELDAAEPGADDLEPAAEVAGDGSDGSPDAELLTEQALEADEGRAETGPTGEVGAEQSEPADGDGEAAPQSRAVGGEHTAGVAEVPVIVAAHESSAVPGLTSVVDLETVLDAPPEEDADPAKPAGDLTDQTAAWVPPWQREVPPVPPVGADAAGEAATGPEPGTGRAFAPEAATEGPVAPSEGAGEAAREPEPRPELTAEELKGAVEAIVLVVDEPATEIVLAQVLDQPVDRIVEVLQQLAREYTENNRGFELRRVAGGWRLYTRPEYAAYVEKFVLDGQQVRLTQAALETLAVVAYKQPVTRSRVSAIRGVNCDGVVRTLVARGLIEECGSEPESGAFLYRTTTLFLEKLGLDNVEQLPPLAPFLPDDVDEIADAQR